MPKVADRVSETTTITGTGDVTLGGTSPNYRTFASAFSDADELYYGIVGAAGWELGIGTYHTGTNTITRTSVLKSSNANALVNFAAGTKTIYSTVPAEFYIASNIASTAVGGIAATNVQAALAELDTDKVSAAHAMAFAIALR